MPIKIRMPNGSLSANIGKEIDERVRKVLLETLRYVGEQCVKNARDNGTYQDQTGNLRSSIGYAIVEDGRVITDGLEAQYQQFKDGKQGLDESKKFLLEVGKRFSGLALVIVAGMNYAVYVERNHHKNVLTSAELLAEKLVPELLQQLGFKVK